MSKTNETSRNELADSELDAVCGGKAGMGSSSYGPGYNSGGGGYPPSPPANAAAMAAWNDLLKPNGF
jgi:hypothetical protein